MDEEGPLNLATDCLLISSLDSTQNCFEKREEIIPKDEVDMIQVETEGLLLGSSQSLSIGNKLKMTLENIPVNFYKIDFKNILEEIFVNFGWSVKIRNCSLL